MEEKILDFIMDYAETHSSVPFQAIEEEFHIPIDNTLKSIISDALWDIDNVSDVYIENNSYVITVFED